MSNPKAFRYQVEQEHIDDLRERIGRTRFPDQPDGATPWETGSDLTAMRSLADHWGNSFDWRRQEERLNAFRQFTVWIDGIELHYLHEPAERPDAPVLLLCHGWPGSVFEFFDLIPRLTHPSRFGGDAAHAVSVVAPSLPGYGLSFQPGQRRFGIAAIADCFARLMRDVLGVQRYFVQGGDWGAFITARMAAIYPGAVVGIHLNMLPVRRTPDRFTISTEDERQFIAQMRKWQHQDIGYIWIQGTRPQTLAFALTDSPVGLAAWLVEKFRAWSDCGGDVENAFDRDHMLGMISFYWFTGAIGSSFWPYYDRLNGEWPIPDDEKITVPLGYAEFPGEMLKPPRSIAETVFADIRSWTVMPHGGHFAALEQPERLATDVLAFVAGIHQ